MKARRRYVLVGGVLVLLVVASALWTERATPTIAVAYPRPFVCGEKLLTGPDAAASQSGLSAVVRATRPAGLTVGPELKATFSADRALYVRGSPAYMFEVLYLRDGVIVGGGPMLNEAGDLSGQWFNLIGGGFPVEPAAPWLADLGRRDRLCAPLSWPAVWSAPQRYEAALVMGPVLPGSEAGRVRLEMPTLGHWPLLVARAPL